MVITLSEINYLSCIVGVVSCRRSMSILGEIVAIIDTSMHFSSRM